MLNAECKHPPKRLYSWIAFDGTVCVGCCDCGEVLAGTAKRMSEDTYIEELPCND